MDIVQILMEIGKHAFVLAVFVALIGAIIYLVSRNIEKDVDISKSKQCNFEKEILEKFDKMDKKFDKEILDKFDNMDKRFDKEILEKFDKMDKKVDKVNDRFMNVDDRFKNSDNQIHEVRQNVQTLTDATTLGFVNVMSEVKDLVYNFKLLVANLGKNTNSFLKEKE